MLIGCSDSNNPDSKLFEKYFGKDGKQNENQPSVFNFDTTQLKKSALMLDEKRYWSIVKKSLKNASSQETQKRILIQEIEKLTPMEMIGFSLRTDKLLYDTYNSVTWCTGYIMNGGCSDDGFDYFRNWIISRGEERYHNAKKNPDNWISEVNQEMEYYEYESFWNVALAAFKNKTGKVLYNYIDDENFKTKEEFYPSIEFTWWENKAESMKKICPKLYKKHWNK